MAACELKEMLDADTYKRWILNIVPVRLDCADIVLGVPTGTFREWLSINYKGLIEDAILKTASLKLNVVFESGYKADCAASDVMPSDDANCSESEEQPRAARQSRRARTADTEEKDEDQGTVVLDRRFRFDTFVVGENSRFAYSACRSVAEHPGEMMNPLFIHSSTGLGKTHLLQAIAQDALARNPKAKVVYVTSEEFLNQFIEAMYKNQFSAFRKKYRCADILLIDDMQFISDKPGFQEEIFHTFNALYGAHKQIVMTSDRSPHEINGLDKRLVSRFEWGLTAEIQVPDLETRIAIVRKKQEEQEYKLDDNVINYVAAKLKSNVRRLESGIFKLVSWASLSNVKIDCAMADKLLSDVFNEEVGTALTVEEIQRMVADYYDIRLADMTSKKRPANIAWPRMVAMFLSRNMTGLSLPSIAEKFVRNHATVLHAVNSVKAKMDCDEDFRREIGIIEHKLKNS
ncbi:MAG: chromosomal replication initiator protein DnaA [Victivallales bacterium]|nr:chromosomal replication initiator protein DnaA [Victivallales bacterium]